MDRIGFSILSNLCSAGRQASLGLLEGAQPPGPREQAVVHPRQDHGPRVRNREDQGLRHVQVPQGTPHQPLTLRNSRFLSRPV